jgi:hypothetical protein
MDFLITILTYFKKKKFLTLNSELLTFLEPKRPFSQEIGGYVFKIENHCVWQIPIFPMRNMGRLYAKCLHKIVYCCFNIP